MPSRFEPCGLGQMIAMRYGTLPIVRATGGLKDTVVDLERAEGTGFVFNNYTSSELFSTISRTINFYKDKSGWQSAQKRCMLKNFSWQASAKKYLNLYDKLLNKVERFNI
jgi:starch synthase